MTTEEVDEIRIMALHLMGLLRGGVDKEEYFQIAYLEGLEAREKGTNVYSAMKGKVSHKLSTSGAPVEVPSSGKNNAAMAKIRRGEEPETEAEVRMAATVGAHTEVLPITVVTTDTPESLLIDSQLQQMLAYCLTSHKVLSARQKESIKCVFFGSPTQEDYLHKYGVERWSLWRSVNKALAKMRDYMDSVS